MLKKWGIGIVILAVVGLLVYGAVIRTSAMNTEQSGVGKGNEENAGRGRSSESGLPAGARVTSDQWVTINGQVSAVDAAHLQVSAKDGKVIEVASRPWLYAQSTLKVQTGDSLSLAGFYEGENFEVGKIIVEKTGQVVVIRDEFGRPMWSGGGRGGNK